MKNKAFGLDIGTNSMKAVWLDHQETDYFLNSVFSLPTPEKGLQSESPLDQEQMSEAIRKIITEGNITAKAVHIALPESQVYTRIVEMPPLSEKELASAIYWEAEQYIPVSLDVITLDYKIIRKPSTGNAANTMEVFLVGAPTSLIEKYERVLGLAGLAVAGVETETLSIIRSISIPEENSTKVIVNIGTVSTTLAILHEGALSFIYNVYVGGTAISRAIATDFGFSLEQAEQYKRTYGLSDQGKIGKITEPIILSIVEEAKKAIVFFNRKYPNSKISHVVLAGGSALLPGIAAFFTRNTGIETIAANPWNILSTQEGIPGEILNEAPAYAVAVGLAMKGG